MSNANSKLHILATAIVALFVGAVFAGTFFGAVDAAGIPADKVAAAGSTIEVSDPGEIVSILDGRMKTSAPTDLLISVSLECSILTNVTTVGNDDSYAFGRIEAWVEIDGVPVGVNAGDDGRVVMCDRAHRQTTSLFDDDDATISSYLKTRSAHSFNWIALNLGSGEHDIVVKALLTEETTTAGAGSAVADAVIGKRTLVAEPTKMANDIVI